MTAEQAILLEKGQQSLDAAKLLLEEGFAGFAAARAYYTMLYTAQALLLSIALSFSRHSAAIAAFGREFAKPELVPREFHRYLIEAQQVRPIADYQGEEVSDEEAELQIQRAEQFLEFAEQYLSADGN